jgi:hypothetical protein
VIDPLKVWQISNIWELQLEKNQDAFMKKLRAD